MSAPGAIARGIGAARLETLACKYHPYRPAWFMTLLDVNSLDKVFTVDERSVSAIDKLTMSVEEHEFVSIVGPSGCGKSTFLHIVGGFEPATRGEIRLAGNPIGPPGPDRGMMFQDLSLFPWLTAIENVAWPLDMNGMAKGERMERARSYLDLVHLARFADLYPGQLSGGMKQRVALARLFALDPQIMLMDEPFGALDSQTRELLQEELQSIWRRARKTALLVTHDIDESIYLATRVIVFTARPGRIKADIPIVDMDRTGDFRKSPEYLALRVQLWDLLREEVLKAKALEEE
jgi:NitT/TauT family transport system ATP-binding protein